jgi:hypothetical protein
VIAVSLLPAASVFAVAASNIAFIIADLAFQPRTADLNMVLASNMGYNAIVQPISLQIVVAVIAFIWVRSAMRAIARADRAEEIAELRGREVEQKMRLNSGVECISQENKLLRGEVTRLTEALHVSRVMSRRKPEPQTQKREEWERT